MYTGKRFSSQDEAGGGVPLFLSYMYILADLGIQLFLARGGLGRGVPGVH